MTQKLNWQVSAENQSTGTLTLVLDLGFDRDKGLLSEILTALGNRYCHLDEPGGEESSAVVEMLEKIADQHGIEWKSIFPA